MGSAASTSSFEERMVNSLLPPNKCPSGCQAELFHRFCQLEQSCDLVDLSPEEIYRFLSERYPSYQESDADIRLTIKDKKPVPLPVRNVTKAKTISAPELIKTILCSEDYSENAFCSVCRIKFDSRRLLQNHLKYSENHEDTCKDCPESSHKSLQSDFNINTVDGNVIEVAQKWKAAVSKTVSPTNRRRYQDLTNTVCFIPNEVKVLFQGLKTFHRSSATSVVVDLRVYFHTESQCIEIVPHIVQTVSAVGTGFRPITASLIESEKTNSFPLEERSRAPAERPKTRKNVTLSPRSNERKRNNGDEITRVIGWNDLSKSSQHTNTVETESIESKQLFIPLPRIYLDYNTLFGSVMAVPNCGVNMLEQTLIAAEQYAAMYQNQDVRRGCAVDVCLDRVLVHYITSHLQMSPETVTPVTGALKHTSKASRRLSISGIMPIKTINSLAPDRISPKSTAQQPTSTVYVSPEARVAANNSTNPQRITVLQSATEELSEEQRIRANFKDYTIRFDDSECGISPVFNAPKVLVPIPAVCADQIYIYCKGKQNNSSDSTIEMQ